MSENEKNETQVPLTIARADTSGNRGNGTSNSALQWAVEFVERQGHHVRLVGIGAPEYPARVNHVPLVSWVAKKQQMQFAEPSDTAVSARRSMVWTWVYLHAVPFRPACLQGHKQMGIAVTAGYHVQPENVTYSVGL